MFKTKGGAGGQRLFEQCSKKLRIWRRMAPLRYPVWYDIDVQFGIRVIRIWLDLVLASPGLRLFSQMVHQSAIVGANERVS